MQKRTSKSKHSTLLHDSPFTTKQKNNEHDSIKIEVGYMRRMPIFKNDILMQFNHFETDEQIDIKTPTSEEIFGNKFCTLLYRHKDEPVVSPRDLFDVYTISQSQNSFDSELFETAMIIDSLMRPEPRIYQHDPQEIVNSVTVDNRLLNLIQSREVPKDLKTQAYDFIKKYISISKQKYHKIIDTFFDEHEFNPRLLKNYDILHSAIASHPSILWNLQRLKK